MPDLPDWWQGFFLVGSDITINVNIEASDVTLPVDIATVTADLDVTIEAVDVTIDINFLDQSVAVWGAAAWFARQGDQVFVYGSGEVGAQVWAALASRTVPTGKTFYMAGFSYGAYQGSNPTYIMATLQLEGDEIMPEGGVQGGGKVFDVPIKATTGQVVSARLVNDDTAGAAYLDVAFWGWDEED